jgi:OPA family glycerol-3-phosphate transporter-like MFS transporter
MFGIICQGVLRDGVTNWMPSYLLETFGLSEEQSIISTVILAVFSVISFAVFSFINDKLFKDEVRSATAIFVMSTAASAVLYVANTVFSASVPVSMLLMAMIVAFMHGVNIMLIAHVPKRFVKFGKVATFSGVLNSCTYVGASISTYAFAAIAETKGWNATILTWIIVSAVGTAVCFSALPVWKKFRKHIDNMR